MLENKFLRWLNQYVFVSELIIASTDKRIKIFRTVDENRTYKDVQHIFIANSPSDNGIIIGCLPMRKSSISRPNSEGFTV